MNWTETFRWSVAPTIEAAPDTTDHPKVSGSPSGSEAVEPKLWLVPSFEADGPVMVPGFGAAFGGADGFTVTEKAAGARLNVPPVELEVCDKEIVADPDACGVTVIVGVLPQLLNVSEIGETVATAELLDATATTRLVEPVRLQPLLPSPFVGFT